MGIRLDYQSQGGVLRQRSREGTSLPRQEGVCLLEFLLGDTQQSLEDLPVHSILGQKELW